MLGDLDFFPSIQLERRVESLMQRFKDLSDIRHTEAEEIAYRFKKSEEIREQGIHRG